MNFRKRFKRDMRDIKTPEIGKVLPGMAENTEGGKRHRKLRRTVIVPLAIALCCIFIISAAATAIPAIIRYLNAQVLTENNTRLTEVPQGYVGIYTAEDLNNIRNSPYKSYILMNDIEFKDADYAPGGICEGGWIPLSTYPETVSFNGIEYTYNKSFAGHFNGNGYVIRNLKINSITDYRNNRNSRSAGLFGETSGNFINLGIEGCEIDLILPEDPALQYSNVTVGTIAGSANFMGGCYATGVTINIVLNSKSYTYNAGREEVTQYPVANIGGLVGYVQYLDSCYTDAKINVSEKGNTASKLFTGGLAGASYSCVTSYFTGNITADPSEFYTCLTDNITVCSIGIAVPVVLSENAMKIANQKVAECYGADSFKYKKFMAYYLRKCPEDCPADSKAKEECEQLVDDIVNSSFFTEDVSDIRCWYLFDPTSSLGENESISELFIGAFGGYENFQAFCLENHVKSGILYCYSFESGKELTEDDLYAFNFNTIWVIKKGQALLKIFES